jgi:hypothetical protein
LEELVILLEVKISRGILALEDFRERIEAEILSIFLMRNTSKVTIPAQLYIKNGAVHNKRDEELWIST